jgi:hypothetical protein
MLGFIDFRTLEVLHRSTKGRMERWVSYSNLVYLNQRQTRESMSSYTCSKGTCTLLYLIAPDGTLWWNGPGHDRFSKLPFKNKVIAIDRIRFMVFVLEETGVLSKFEIGDWPEVKFITDGVVEIYTNDHLHVMMNDDTARVLAYGGYHPPAPHVISCLAWGSRTLTIPNSPPDGYEKAIAFSGDQLAVMAGKIYYRHGETPSPNYAYKFKPNGVLSAPSAFGDRPKYYLGPGLLHRMWRWKNYR